VSEEKLGSHRKVAVITGASSGIGEVFARRLADAGHDLLIVARRKELLEKQATDLRDKTGVKVEWESLDLADSSQLDQLVRRIEEMSSIDFLVHAAGFGYMGDFVELPIEKHLRMLDLHTTATVKLCYAALPKMIRAKKGVLINVSSLASWTVGPGQCVYNSSKAFIKIFTESLHAEVRGTNVMVQALCPGVTRTGFHNTEEFAKFNSSDMPGPWMSPEDVVEESFASLAQNRAVCVPGLKNRVLTYLFSSDTIRRLAGDKVRKRPVNESV